MGANRSYLRYVIRHKWFVLIAGLRVGAPLWRLIIHDWSKFLPCEWRPYAKFFYGMPKVGDRVFIDSYEGFGGWATVIEERRCTKSRYKVRITDEWTQHTQEFWAHDFEVIGLDEAKAAFDAAWNHHQKCQPHHWQYWLLTMDSGETVATPMPEAFIREMVADWIGAGWAIRNCKSYAEAVLGTADWYEANKSRMQLCLSTRSRVEEIIGEAVVSHTAKAAA